MVTMIALIIEEQLVVHQPHVQKLLTTDVQPFSNFVSPARLNDLGNLMLTLVILWAYMALAQFIVIWMGNTSEDIPWYTQRGMDALHPNPWRWYGLALVVCHFAVPFSFCSSKRTSAGWLCSARWRLPSDPAATGYDLALRADHHRTDGPESTVGGLGEFHGPARPHRHRRGVVQWLCPTRWSLIP